MRRRTLQLTTVERSALTRTRNRDARAYLRERCAVLLAIADGLSVRQAARRGGLRPRHPETVSDWLNRYLASGLAGLVQYPRRHAGGPP